MISGDFTSCTSLDEFYYKIEKLHRETHGEGYTDVHGAIQEAVRGKFYIELGINQGATLAAACLSDPAQVKAYDLHIDRVKPHQHVFNNTSFPLEIKKGNSIDSKIVEECDVLYIDTMHVASHLQKELNLWHEHVKEKIICHDTYVKSELSKLIDKWSSKRNEWSVTHNTSSVGYSVLERK